MGDLFLNVIFPLYLLIGIGFLVGKLKPDFRTTDISFLVLYVFAPALILCSFRTVSVSRELVGCITLVAVFVFVGTLLLAFAAEKLFLGKRNAAFEISSTVMNAGYLGIPLIYLMFGEKALPIAVTYMVVMALLHFTAGVALLGDGLADGVKSALKLPLIYAVFFSFVFRDFPLPDGFEKVLKLTGDATMPLMLVALGVNLSRIPTSYLGISVIASAVRFLGGTLSALLAVFLMPIPSELKAPLIVQSSLPSAVLNFVLCEKFGKSPGLAASIIFISTLLFPIYLPFLSLLLARLGV